MKTNFINLIGIEAEGGWHRLPSTDWNGFHSEIKQDGSLDFLYGEDIDEDTTVEYVREITSPPLKSDKVEEWLRYYTPDKVNHTCGLHVHMSMPQKYYILLTEERFWKWFRMEMKKLGEELFPQGIYTSKTAKQFWNRLHGRNNYCKAEFNPWSQLSGAGARYTQVNFNAYLVHKTVEFRILPGIDDPDLACKAVMGMIGLVENYLAAASQLAVPKTKLILREIDINGEKDIICV